MISLTTIVVIEAVICCIVKHGLKRFIPDVLNRFSKVINYGHDKARIPLLSRQSLRIFYS